MKKGLRAWLVTWEWCGEHAKVENPIAEILDPRLSARQVRDLIDLRYNQDASLSEKMAWRLRKCSQPYRAEFQTIEGVPWEGEIICGHNPYLRARLVDELIVTKDGEGREIASWRDRYPVREAREKIKANKKRVFGAS